MTPSAHTVDLAGVASALSLFLLACLLLTIVFLLSSYVLARTMRRFRRAVVWRRAAPSANEDVWAMHKLPDDYDIE